MGSAIKPKKLSHQAYLRLHEYGSLEQVLASNVSLEIKEACIALAIQARKAKAAENGEKG